MGKSNVLDALLFALTQDVSLRSRNWGELRTRSHRGPCAVALRIQPPASGEPISIVAHVKDDATRLLKLNEKQATVSQVRAALRQARLEAEDTSFAKREKSPLRARVAVMHAHCQRRRPALAVSCNRQGSRRVPGCVRRPSCVGCGDSCHPGRLRSGSTPPRAYWTARTC